MTIPKIITATPEQAAVVRSIGGLCLSIANRLPASPVPADMKQKVAELLDSIVAIADRRTFDVAALPDLQAARDGLAQLDTSLSSLLPSN